MSNIKHFVKICGLRLPLLRRGLRALLGAALVCVTLGAAQTRAEDAAEKPITAPAGGGVVVAELFSSQACVFCPRADRLLADLAEQNNVIALACHVDYFDVRTGSLAQRFCTMRQHWYMRILRAGPNYTPQMVVQGQHDAIGYDMQAVQTALQKAAAHKPAAINITHAAQEGGFELAMPAADDAQNARVWMMIYDAPHDITVAEGRNRGQKMRYVNVISELRDLGAWDGGAGLRMLEVVPTARQRGFAVLAQDEKTGHIIAAGRFEFARDVPPPAADVFIEHTDIITPVDAEITNDAADDQPAIIEEESGNDEAAATDSDAVESAAE